MKEKEESELEEIVDESGDDSEDENEKTPKKNSKKDKTKKPQTIIPESVWNESRNRNLLNFLNRNSSVTLDKNMIEEIPKNLELTIENEQPIPKNQNQNLEDREKSEFEYITKASDKEKQQGVYQHYENVSGAKLIRQSELKSLQKPFEQEAGRVEYETNRGPKGFEEYKINVKTQRVEDLQKDKKEKGIFMTEAKREYYSHDN